MKKLLIMRHGKSSWKDTTLSDHERPLKKRGRKDSSRMGKHLNALDLVPDIILCSSARRARQTAKNLISEFYVDVVVEYLDTFYMADPEVYISMLQTQPDVNTVMIIGHNPGLESLMQMLCDEIESLPTSATAYLTLPIDRWGDLELDTEGKLKHLWLPREIA